MPLILLGQLLLWSRELLNPFRRQAAEWELVWLRRLAGKWDCPVSVEATMCAVGLRGAGSMRGTCSSPNSETRHRALPLLLNHTGFLPHLNPDYL